MRTCFRCPSKAVRVFATALFLACIVCLLSSFSTPALSMQGPFPMSIGSTSESEPEEICVLDDAEISEASGIAVSRRHNNAVWIHNDSGDSARLFLVGLDGKTRAIVTLNVDRPLDWEDMCSFEAEGESWLLIGDIGDNQRVRSKGGRSCELLLIKEPRFDVQPGTIVNAKADVISRIEYQFPDGPEDCESLAVDTESKEILLLTKCVPQKCQLFRIPLSTKAGRRKVVAEPVASLAVPFATSMDVASNGRSLIIVNMFSGALIRREETQTWAAACKQPITVLTLPAQPQCETVCFAKDNDVAFVTSERTHQPLWKILLPKPEANTN